ncbi:MAG TPA: sensor histidine kinase [Acidimicrobiales bacterium]|nr:sensor histidine kinase [Acidimicrobiales bacterium]
MHVRGIRHPYSWGRDHPLVSDAFIALLVFAFGLLTEVTQPDPSATSDLRDPSAFSVALVALGTLPLLARRRWPLGVFAVIWATTLLHSGLAYPGAGPIAGSLFGLYAVAAHAERRRHAVYALLGALTSSVIFPLLHSGGASWGDLIGIYALLIAAWVLGDNMRVRRANVAAVEERAARLERESDVEAQRAVLQERARIARELHDVVAHSMSVMVVQAGAARRTLARDPDRATEALTQIERTGRGALDEMRRLVGVLRHDADDGAVPADESAARQPQPGIGEVPQLIRQCRDAGLAVSLAVVGPERPLPSGVELVVYRVVQEALTNTMKHAGPARADVVLRYGDDAVSLIVCDDGRGAAADGRPGPVSGHGLTGMRERVSLYGGSIDAGPQPGGGFRVWAEVPVSADLAGR